MKEAGDDRLVEMAGQIVRSFNFPPALLVWMMDNAEADIATVLDTVHSECVKLQEGMARATGMPDKQHAGRVLAETTMKQVWGTDDVKLTPLAGVVMTYDEVTDWIYDELMPTGLVTLKTRLLGGSGRRSR